MNMKRFNYDTRKLVVFLGLVLLFFLLMGLSARINELNQLSEQNNLMNTEVSILKATNDQLTTAIAYANSDAAVEQYARESGYMVKPGEVLVIPISPIVITPTIPAVVPQTVEQIPNWKIWYQLFFADIN